MSEQSSTVWADGYTNPELYPLLDPTEQQRLLAQIQAESQAYVNGDRAIQPMTAEETQLMLGLLRYIDYCLPADRQSRASRSNVRTVRMVGLTAMDLVPTGRLEVADLQQDLRLVTLSVMRNFKAEKGFSIFASLTREL
jgi:hypothetical protein